MTRVEFYFNLPDKLVKTAELCEKAVSKGRQLTIFTQDEVMNQALQQQLWHHSATSFLTNAKPDHAISAFSAILLDSNGEKLLQDDILINLQAQHPPFFSRFRHLVAVSYTHLDVYKRQAPSLIKLGACFIYEVLVVIAILFVCALVFLMFFGDASHGIKRVGLQLFLWLAVGVYFVWCWHKGGQTLARCV